MDTSSPSLAIYFQQHPSATSKNHFLLSHHDAEWFVFFNGAQECFPDYSEFLESIPDILHPCTVFFPEFDENSPDISFASFYEKNNFYFPLLIVHRSAFEAIGKFNPKCTFLENTEWILRLLETNMDMDIRYLSEYPRSEHFRVQHPDIPLFSDMPSGKTALEQLSICAFLISHHKKTLLSLNYFNSITESLIQEANASGNLNYFSSILEDMLTEKEIYWELALPIQKFLIYYDDSNCHGLLGIFADFFIQGLKKRFELIEIFNVSNATILHFSKYLGQHYQAVIGFTTNAFSVHTEQTGYLNNYILAPKYNFIFDHPAYLDLDEKVDNLHFLVLDIIGIIFIKY